MWNCRRCSPWMVNSSWSLVRREVETGSSSILGMSLAILRIRSWCPTLAITDSRYILGCLTWFFTNLLSVVLASRRLPCQIRVRWTALEALWQPQGGFLHCRQSGGILVGQSANHLLMIWILNSYLTGCSYWFQQPPPPCDQSRFPGSSGEEVNSYEVSQCSLKESDFMKFSPVPWVRRHKRWGVHPTQRGHCRRRGQHYCSGQ